MSTDDLRQLIGAYALDAVDDVERRAVERLVATDAEAARELAAFRATAAMLGSAAAAPPPPDLRAGVLSAIARVPQVAAAPTPGPGAGTATTGPVARRPRRTTTWLAVAATAVAAAAIPSTLAIQQAQRSEQVEQRARVLADLLADPQAQVVRAEVAGGGTAVGVLAGDRALLTATGLEEPGEGLEYQLWVIRDGEALPDAVMADDGGAVQAVTEEYQPGDALAVTVEPAAGSRQPTSEPVVVLAPVST